MNRIISAEIEELDTAIWSSWPLIQDLAQELKQDQIKSTGVRRVRVLITQGEQK